MGRLTFKKKTRPIRHLTLLLFFPQRERAGVVGFFVSFFTLVVGAFPSLFVLCCFFKS